MKNFRVVLLLVLILSTTNSLPADAGILRKMRRVIVAPVVLVKNYFRDLTYEVRVAYFFEGQQ